MMAEMIEGPAQAGDYRAGGPLFHLEVSHNDR